MRRTAYAARYLSDPDHRRKIARQLNKCESLHALGMRWLKSPATTVGVDGSKRAASTSSCSRQSRCSDHAEASRPVLTCARAHGMQTARIRIGG
ncbi:hypothetical protein GCM10027068_23950 [Prescottella soli]